MYSVCVYGYGVTLHDLLFMTILMTNLWIVCCFRSRKVVDYSKFSRDGDSDGIFIIMYYCLLVQNIY